ncbi:cupin domain-containing protein [Labrys neptuniae]
MPEDVLIINESQGDLIGVAGDNYRTILSGAQTEGSLSIFDMLVPPGGGPMPHRHPKIQEWFFVVEGELVYKTEAGRATVKKGGLVYIPFDGGVHCFKNEGNEVARVLCGIMPAGLEAVFKLIGVPVGPGEFPPPSALSETVQTDLHALAGKLEITVYPPDYLD